MTEQAHVIEITADNFQTEVVERSETLPVLIDIWAPWCEPCKQQLPTLLKLVEACRGKFVLARLNAEDSDPRVAQMAQGLMMQLGLRSIPAMILLHRGQPVEVLTGLQSEADLRLMLDELTMSPVERVVQEVAALQEAGELDQALALLQQILADEPDNHGLQVVQVNLLLELGRIEDAKQLLAALPDDAEGIRQPKAKLEFYEMARDLPTLAELDQQLAEEPESLELVYQRAIRWVLADRVEDALESLLGIMREDCGFREDGARLLLLKLFDYLGKGDELASRYRRRLFSLLH